MSLTIAHSFNACYDLILEDLLVNISYLCILRIKVLLFLAPESSGELVFKKIISFLLPNV